MNKAYLFKIIFLILLVINGCGHAVEFARTSWGSSIRMLENAREDAFSRQYECQYNVCFDEIINILEENEARVFIKDRDRYVIVAMDIKDCISTTEVGIFFVEEAPNKIKIEVASLSPKAKRITSEILFSALDLLYAVGSN